MGTRGKLGEVHAGSWERYTREVGRGTRGKLEWVNAGSWERDTREVGRAALR